jgi:hypothetical protein
MEAFGDKFIHIDLKSANALAEINATKKKRGIHRDLHATTKASHTSNAKWYRYGPKDKQWQWRSSVCHKTARILLSTEFSNEPWNDNCRAGNRWGCSA